MDTARAKINKYGQCNNYEGLQKYSDKLLNLEDDIVINNPDFISIIEKIPISAYDLIYVGRKKLLTVDE